MPSRDVPSSDTDPATLPPSNTAQTGGSIAALETIGLCLLWSRDAPERVGELLLLPPDDRGAWTFGRGPSSEGDRRLTLVRQVPGDVVSGGALTCPRISRSQLRLSVAPDGGLRVENVGSCPLVHLGREVSRVDLVVGDTLSLRSELLFLCVRRAPIARAVSDELVVPIHPFGGPDRFGIVGESPAVWDLRRHIVALARQRFHVLIQGASGSGKELVAQAIHAQSTRSDRAMVSRNAATIPEGIAAAELFGNLRSYPNPGMPERPGLVGEANGSTLFLDEFAELPPTVQAQLLRVMDDGEYQRLGEAKTRQTDLRILAATNRPASEIKHDILARLKVRVTVPDLAARKEDIPLLVAHLLRQHARSEPGLGRRFFPGGDPRQAPLVSPVLMEALVRHPYTTHVRELDALVVRAALEGQGKHLELVPGLKNDLHARPARTARAPARAPDCLDALTSDERARLDLLRKHRFSPTACGRDPAYPGNRQTADLHLRRLLCRGLELTDWNVERAAEVLAGDGPRELRQKCSARLATFVGNLVARLVSEGPEALREALLEEWKESGEGLFLLVQAKAAPGASAAPG